MNIVNCTPHNVNVIMSSGEEVVFMPCGEVARVEMTTEEISTVACVPVVKATFGEAVLPNIEADAYIVSTMFATAYREQGGAAKLYVPDTGPTAIRVDGQIKAVKALIEK